MNDSGEIATALRVTFSESVIITGFGDTLMAVSPPTQSLEFTFSGGHVESWGTHWLNWEPASAELLGSEWLAQEPSPQFEGRSAGDPLVLEEAVYELQVELASEDVNSPISGSVTVFVRQIWPFSVRIRSDIKTVESYRWTVGSESLTGRDVSLSLLCVDSNYEWMALSLEAIDAKGNVYCWEHEMPLDIFNKTDVILDATCLFPDEELQTVEWTASNMVGERPEAFPVVEPDKPITSISSYWPNVVDIRATVTTTDGRTLTRHGEILFFERDMNPVPLRGVVATCSANLMDFYSWEQERIFRDAFAFLERFGATALQHHSAWFHDMPEVGQDFVIRPYYTEPFEYHDSRGANAAPELLGRYFDLGQEAGFQMILEQRLKVLQNDVQRLENLWDQANSYAGSETAFLERMGDGFLYSPEGLRNVFMTMGEFAIEHDAAGYVLDLETNAWIQHGGETYRSFYTDVVELLRADGFNGFLTFSPNFAGRAGMDDSPWPDAYDALLDPAVCGIPFQHDDMSLSVTLYPSVDLADSAPMQDVFGAAMDYLEHAILPFSRAYGGKPIYIEDMQCMAVEGALSNPTGLEAARSELGQVKWFWGMWRAVYELNRLYGTVFSGVTSAYYALIPEGYRPQSPGDTDFWQSQKSPYLDFPFNEYIAKALTVFYADRGCKAMQSEEYDGRDAMPISSCAGDISRDACAASSCGSSRSAQASSSLLYSESASSLPITLQLLDQLSQVESGCVEISVTVRAKGRGTETSVPVLFFLINGKAAAEIPICSPDDWNLYAASLSISTGEIALSLGLANPGPGMHLSVDFVDLGSERFEVEALKRSHIFGDPPELDPTFVTFYMPGALTWLLDVTRE